MKEKTLLHSNPFNMKIRFVRKYVQCKFIPKEKKNNLHSKNIFRLFQIEINALTLTKKKKHHKVHKHFAYNTAFALQAK